MRHHWLNGHELGHTQGDGQGQGSLAHCSPWGHKEKDMTRRLNNHNMVYLLILVLFNVKSFTFLLGVVFVNGQHHCAQYGQHHCAQYKLFPWEKFLKKTSLGQWNNYLLTPLLNLLKRKNHKVGLRLSSAVLSLWGPPAKITANPREGGGPAFCTPWCFPCMLDRKCSSLQNKIRKLARN